MPILVHHNNQQLGPYPEATVRQMLADGRLPPDALAWREGMAEWKPLSQLLASSAALVAAPAASAGVLKWGLAAGALVTVLALGGVGTWQYGEHQKLQQEKERLALEQQRLEEEQARAEEQRRMEAQRQADAERQRLEEEKRLAEEKSRELEQRLEDERQQLARERQQRAREREQRVYQTQAPAPRQPESNFPHGGANSGYGTYGAPPPPPNVCRECGVVQYVRAIEQPGQGTGMGAVIGGVAGGVLGNQIGKGRGNDAATVIGAVGGAVAGHQIEKSQRRSTVYGVQVRFDDGSVRTVSSQQAWRQGDRVRLYNGALVGQY